MRRSTAGRRQPTFSFSTSNSNRQKSASEAASESISKLLSNLPKVRKTLGELENAENLFSQPKQEKWGMEVQIESKGNDVPDSWEGAVKRINSVGAVQNMLKALIGDHQKTAWERAYQKYFPASAQSKTSEDVFKNWAADTRIQNQKIDSTAMEYFLSADAKTKTAVAALSEETTAAHTNQSDTVNTNALAKVTTELVNLQTNTKKAVQTQTTLSEKLKKADAAFKAAPQKKGLAKALGKAQEAYDAAAKVTTDFEGEFQKLIAKSTALSQIQTPTYTAPTNMYTGSDQTIKKEGSGKDWAGDTWTPFFSKQGYLCSPSNNVYGFDGDGECALDTGESGTDFNAVRIHALQVAENEQAKKAGRDPKPINFDTLPGVKKVSDIYYQKMPWGWRAPGTTYTDWSRIGQPLYKMEGNRIVDDSASGGYLDNRQNEFPRDDINLYNSEKLTVLNKEGKPVITQLMCDPLQPKQLVQEDGVTPAWYCEVAKDPRFHDPDLLNEKGAYTKMTGDNSSILEGTLSKKQFARMPAGWNPYEAREVGQGGAALHDQSMYFDPVSVAKGAIEDVDNDYEDAVTGPEADESEGSEVPSDVETEVNAS
jgi:hypothetical protein